MYVEILRVINSNSSRGNDYVIADTTITATPQQLKIVLAIADNYDMKRDASDRQLPQQQQQQRFSEYCRETVQSHSCADIVHSLPLLN